MLFIAATNAKRDATTILITLVYFKIAELRKTTTVRTKSVCTHAGGVCLKREDLSLSSIHCSETLRCRRSRCLYVFMANT